MSHFDHLKSLKLGRGMAEKPAQVPGSDSRQQFKTPPGMYRGGRRNYDAAKVDNQTMKWPTFPVHIDFILEYQHRIIVARSREQYANNDYVKNFSRVLRRNIIGPNGIALQCKGKDPNGKLDDKANKAVEAAWKKWGEDGNCEVTGRLSWLQVKNLAIQTIARDGEVLIRFIYGKDAGPMGFSVQLIDPQRIPIFLKREGVNGENPIRNGIEFNQYGRPVAYYFSKDDTPEKAYWGSGMPDLFQRVKAEDILHVFLPEYIGQKRGIPWAVSALYRLNQINKFEEASVINARTGATKMGFFKRAYETADEITNAATKGNTGNAPTGAPTMNALGEFGTNPADPWNGDAEDEQAGFVLDGEPGTWESLPVGWEPVPWDPMFPTGEFEGFNKAQLRGASAGMGIAYHTLANDLTDVNFSSIRQGALDERDEWLLLQTWFIGSCVHKVYKKWLSYYLLAGKISLPNGAAIPFAKLDKFSEVMWQGRRWQWIDPQKDVTAAAMQLDKLLIAPSDIIRESGREPEHVWEQTAQDIASMKEKGIPDELIEKFMSQTGVSPNAKADATSDGGDKGSATDASATDKPKKKK